VPFTAKYERKAVGSKISANPARSAAKNTTLGFLGNQSSIRRFLFVELFPAMVTSRLRRIPMRPMNKLVKQKCVANFLKIRIDDVTRVRVNNYVNIRI